MNQGIQKKKTDPQILKDLKSTDNHLVLKTLRKLRNIGHLDYMPVLFTLLSQAKNKPIERELVRFMADIKVKAIVPVFVEGLKDPGLTGSQAGMLSAIWQSGLDYSQHLDLFIQIFLEGNYLVALESFTVIEQSLGNLKDLEIKDERKILLKGLAKVSKKKKPLARELIQLLQV